MKKRIAALLLVLLTVLSLSGCQTFLSAAQQALEATATTQPQATMALPVLSEEEDDAAETASDPKDTPQADAAAQQQPAETPALEQDGSYTTKEDVALYLSLYGRLPDNFITKKEAKAQGWPGGGLDDYVYGACIGGDRFGNNEGLLPEKQGRSYYECDIGTLHQSSRGAKRIVYSNDGLIYYTEDHYESFTLLYGEE